MKGGKVDRVAQVNWIRDLAASLAGLADGTHSEDEIVEWALSKQGARQLDITLPGWFDDHDRMLLTDMVGDSIYMEGVGHVL